MVLFEQRISYMSMIYYFSINYFLAMGEILEKWRRAFSNDNELYLMERSLNQWHGVFSQW